MAPYPNPVSAFSQHLRHADRRTLVFGWDGVEQNDAGEDYDGQLLGNGATSETVVDRQDHIIGVLPDDTGAATIGKGTETTGQWDQSGGDKVCHNS